MSFNAFGFAAFTVFFAAWAGATTALVNPREPIRMATPIRVCLSRGCMGCMGDVLFSSNGSGGCVSTSSPEHLGRPDDTYEKNVESPKYPQSHHIQR